VRAYTLGAVAKRYGVRLWQVRRLYERRILPEPARLGLYRVVTDADLPTIHRALIAAGYLRPEREEVRS
jgi:hypothetical protein